MHGIVKYNILCKSTSIITLLPSPLFSIFSLSLSHTRTQNESWRRRRQVEDDDDDDDDEDDDSDDENHGDDDDDDKEEEKEDNEEKKMKNYFLLLENCGKGRKGGKKEKKITY